VDSTGATIDFLLSAKRDTVAAKRFLTKALDGKNHPAPRVINTDEDAAYPPAIVQLWGAWRTKSRLRGHPYDPQSQACGSAPPARVNLLHRFIVSMFGMEV
jgi:hypothetical protein